ncbi:hypothetical protein SE15cs_02859 [Salmonella enterica subsp. enterica serovar Typhimurium]|nr:hypothetical protein SE15cs_02859 [Salmonella enterica subsp. enterica serovar Typhimurium]
MTLCPGSALPVNPGRGQNAPTERRFYKTEIDKIKLFFRSLITRNTQVRWYSTVQGSPPLPCRRRTILTVCQRLSVWVMAGSDTIVAIRYLMMKVMLAPTYKAPGNIYQALCRQKTIKHQFLVLQELLENMATHSYWVLLSGLARDFVLPPGLLKDRVTALNPWVSFFALVHPL